MSTDFSEGGRRVFSLGEDRESFPLAEMDRLISLCLRLAEDAPAQTADSGIGCVLQFF